MAKQWQCKVYRDGRYDTVHDDGRMTKGNYNKDFERAIRTVYRKEDWAKAMNGQW